jgi:hypothetical protein
MKKITMMCIIILVQMNLFTDNFEYQSTLLETETVRQFEIFDIDNDGLWELLIGRHDNDENGYLNLYKQDEPNGTSFSLISEQWIYLGSLSFHAFSSVADLDNDGLWDILIGLTDGTLSHYKQDEFNSYDFSLVTHNFNNIDVGFTAIPTFVDIDNNGLLDLYIGNNSHNVKHYEQSSSNSLLFNLISEDIFQGFYYGTHIKPSFYDLDGDGLMNLMFATNYGFYCREQDSENSTVFVNEDYIVDHLDGTALYYPIFFDFDGDSHPDFFAFKNYDIHYYEASYSLPLDFSKITENLSGIDVGSHSVPAICDFDEDGLLELFIGTDDGRIERWEQASLNSTDFVLISSNFSGINLSANGGKTAPFFYDINNDGNLDLLVGTSQGNVYLFEKDSPDTVTLLDNHFLLIGSNNNNTVPTIGDIDGDGLLDLLIGNGFGELKHYEQDAVNSYAFSYVGYFNDVNYGSKIYPALCDLENDGILDLLIGKANGRISHYRQSEINSYEFALLSDTYSLIDVGSNASPLVTDLDGDGNDDLLIGEASGNINHYESIDLPTVTTIEVTNITGMGADIHGNVTDDGGSDILARGVCYNTTGNPTLSDDYRISAPGTGSFTTRPTTLHISTLYFVRTFATNAAGTSYGEELSFTTAGLPEVLTKSIHSVSTNSAVCVGEVTAENGSNVVARGILWGTSPNLTVLDDYVASGTGIGEFSITLSNLEPDSYYYVKTFARNDVGLSFGEELSFSTPSHHRNMLDFSASNGNITVPLQLPDTGTIEFWAKTTLIYTDRTLWHASENESQGWFCEISSNNLRAFIQGAALTYPGITDNKWYHIAITWNCYSQFGLGYAASQLYVNGNLIETYLSPIIDSQSTNFTIGTQMNGSNAFNGQMDEFRLWNTIRTENDIRENMFEFIEPASDNLICYYSFDSFEGSDAVDNSGNGNNGTMNNFPIDPWFISTAPMGEEGIGLRSTTPASVGMSGKNMSVTITGGANDNNHLGIYTCDDGFAEIESEAFPVNILNRADIIWGIEEFGNVTANIEIDYSNVTALDDSNSIRLLKRTNASSEWFHYSYHAIHDELNKTFTLNEQTDFSEFSLANSNSPGLAGYCLDFNGINAFVDVGNDTSLDFEKTITIEAWIKPSSLSGRHGIFSTRSQNASGSFQLEVGAASGGINRIAVTGVNTWVAQTGDNVISVGEWNHIAYTRSGEGAGMHKIYVNGHEQTLISDADYSFVPNISTKVIASGTNNGQFYEGLIEEVRLWNKCKSAEEIRENMYIPLSGNETGLVSCWQFNEESGTVTQDVISGNNGTLMNMTDDVRILSTIPFGAGISVSHMLNSSGNYNFTGTDFMLSLYNIVTEEPITVAKLDAEPNMLPDSVDTVFNEQYWIINSFGDENYSGDLTFSNLDGITQYDVENPSFIKLFSRESNSDGEWNLADSAINVQVNGSQNEITFENIEQFSQLIIARWIQEIDSPQNVTIQQIGTDIQITWDEVAGANSYKIFAADSPDGEFVEVTASGSFAAKNAPLLQNSIWQVEHQKKSHFGELTVAKENEQNRSTQTWTAPIDATKKFYYIKASSESRNKSKKVFLKRK